MQPLSVTRSLCSAVLHLKYLKLTDRLECPRSLQHAPMLGGKVPIFLGRDKTLEPHFFSRLTWLCAKGGLIKYRKMDEHGLLY